MKMKKDSKKLVCVEPLHPSGTALAIQTPQS